jgi:glucose-1-phosphate thymidylyltransferase
MKAYVLVAGYATRLHPLTLDRPKALLEIAGRPLLSHIYDRIVELDGLREIVIVGNRRFAAPLREWCDAIGGDLPVHLLDDGSMSDADKLGAIGDLDFALRSNPPDSGEPIVALAGDNWLGFDLRPAERAFAAVPEETLLLLRDLGAIPSGPSPYNEVTLDDRKRVVGFREKPIDPKTDLAAIAFYFFPAGVSAFVRRYLAEGGNPDAPGFFIEWLVANEPVRGHPIEGEWMDIGSHETLAAARARFG